MQLQLDLNETTPLNNFWTFGANTCHAALWFRKDLQNHLRIEKEELKFRYVRAHGTINDDMGVVDEQGNFHYEKVCDGVQILLDLGLKPFFEISSMPGAMRSNDKGLTAYGFNSAPPTDWNQWYELVKGLMAAFKSRFGLDEMKTWYFEVWNEPDIAFWSGTQEEYFKLYDLAARAVKECDPELRIGGPATARTNWIDEFLAHVTKPSTDFGLDMPRCDFIATHAYPSDLEFLDAAEGEVELQNSNIMRELFAAARRKIDAALGENFPLIIGEWNSSAGPLAFNHDECNNGAYVTKTMVELMPLCQGSLYWNASDIYEECNFHYAPFHGGYGLLTVNDLPKAAFHGFRLLGEHAGEAVKAGFDKAVEGVGCLATKNGDTLRVFAYYYAEPGSDGAGEVEFTLSGVPAGAKATVEAVVPGKGSAYETWRELGSPEYLNREIFDTLEAASKPETRKVDIASETICLKRGSILQVTLAC